MRAVVAVLALIALAGCGGSGDGGERAAIGQPGLNDVHSIDDFKRLFDAGEGSARLVVLLSPT